MLFGRLYTAPASAMDYCDSSGEPTVLSDAPACTFCRGFVLSYALLLRLDPAWEPWVSRHLTDVCCISAGCLPGQVPLPSAGLSQKAIISKKMDQQMEQVPPVSPASLSRHHYNQPLSPLPPPSQCRKAYLLLWGSH